MTTSKAIDRKIASFVTSRDKLKNMAHEIAMMIFDHAKEHGDCTRAIKLAVQLPNSWQPQMEAWFKAFSPIRVIIKNSKCEFAPEYKKAAAANKADYWDREAAVATPFFDIMEEPKVDKVYDFDALVKMVERLSGLIEKKVEAGAVPEADIPSAQAIALRIKALKFDRVAVEAPANNDDVPQLQAVAA